MVKWLFSSRIPCHAFWSSHTSIFENLLLEDALLRCLRQQSLHETQPRFEPPLPPTSLCCVVLFWRNSPAVVLGRNQLPWLECNVPYLRSHHPAPIALARRLSGGGCVFHDLQTLCMTYFVPNCHALFQRKVGRNQFLVTALQQELQLPAEVQALASGAGVVVRCASSQGNASLASDWKKIAGAASRITPPWACHHLCVMVNTDVAKLWACLTPTVTVSVPSPQASVRSQRLPVVNLAELLPEITVQQTARAMLRSLAAAGGWDTPAEIRPLALSHLEPWVDSTLLLASPAWVFQQGPKLPLTLTFPLPCKLLPSSQPLTILCTIVVRSGLIQSITVTPSATEGSPEAEFLRTTASEFTPTTVLAIQFYPSSPSQPPGTSSHPQTFHQVSHYLTTCLYNTLYAPLELRQRLTKDILAKQASLTTVREEVTVLPLATVLTELLKQG